MTGLLLDFQKPIFIRAKRKLYQRPETGASEKCQGDTYCISRRNFFGGKQLWVL
jgi:hypothetical protein